MALNLDAVGKKIGPVTKEYTWKDAALYALGVGAGFSELSYCYEKDLQVLPTFSMAAIMDYFWLMGSTSGVNPAGILHGEQELIFHHPIPPEGTLTTEGCITHYYDKGKEKGALVVAQSDTVHSNGKKLFTSIVTLFARLDGGFGGPDAPKKDVIFPERDPDFVVEARPGPDQPLLYRLSGDTFPLHADPEFARLAGFEKPIMHGLCTYGFACRALIESLIPGRPETVRRIACRFSKPLYPGVPIQTLIWKIEDGKAVWRTVNAETSEPVIDRGVFEYGDAPKDEIRFDGRVAVITGAGGGLGRVYALQTAGRGAKVVVNDPGCARNGSGEGSKTPADQVVDAIRAAGGEALASYDSVSTPEGGEKIVRTAMDAFGRIDMLIHNAGILRDKSFLKMTPEEWQTVLDVHLNGAYHVCRPAFRVMKEQGYGRIILASSAAGLYGNFGQTNYSAAKMGLVGLMNTLKIEGQKYDIKVNAVAPLAASRLSEDVLPADLLDKLKPEMVAPLVLFLCSDRCPVSGNIYNAAMGSFNRAAVVTGPGVVLSKDGDTPTPEQVSAEWESIASLKNGRVYGQLSEQVGDILDALSKSATRSKPGKKGFTSVAEVFAAMPGAFQPEAAAGVDVVFQYRVSGEGGGDWHCIIRDKTCVVQEGSHENPTCTLKIKDADFLDMMNGRLIPMQAYTSGRLKIEGDVMKSQLIEKLFKMASG